MLFRDDERQREVIVINKGSGTGRASELLMARRQQKPEKNGSKLWQEMLNDLELHTQSVKMQDKSRSFSNMQGGACMFCRIQPFVTPWVPLSVEFSRQEWSGLPFLSPDLPNRGIEPMSPALAGGFFTSWATRGTHTCQVGSFLKNGHNILQFLHQEAASLSPPLESRSGHMISLYNGTGANTTQSEAQKGTVCARSCPLMSLRTQRSPWRSQGWSPRMTDHVNGVRPQPPQSSQLKTQIWEWDHLELSSPS